jgi:predicted DsbA family dithiol-disulfide isomerase
MSANDNGEGEAATQGDAVTPLRIDVVSDVMCPWCFIGKRRLEKALAETADVEVTVEWHPFQLDPTLPPEGKDRQQYLAEKFGGPERAEAIYDRVRAAGADEAIPFAFERIARSPNTIDAHRLIRWAGIEGVQDRVVERLFSLYFVEGADLTDRATLVAAAVDGGMDGAVVARLLDSDADRADVEADVARAVAIGVQGVPTFIFDGRYAVSGAQPPEVLARAIRQVAAEKAGAPVA